MSHLYQESELLKPAKESPIREFMTRYAQMKNRFPDTISFSAGEPDFDTPEEIKQATIDALQANETHYASAYGVSALREVIATQIKEETGCCYQPEDEIIVTCGAAEALNNVILSFFGKGDEVIVLTPAFITYENLITMSGASFVEVALKKENQYQLDLEDIKKATTERTRAILINNPSNPTGAVFEKEGLEQLCNWVKERDLLLISDEIYSNIVYEEKKAYSIASFPNMKERLILINGYSKTYAMTGWRIGYIAADKRFTDSLIKFHTYSSTCAPTFLQIGIANAIGLASTKRRAKEMVQEFERRRNLVVEKLSAIKALSFTIPYGAFYILIDVSKTGQTGQEFAEDLLEQYHVAVVPAGSMGSGCNNIVRLAYTCQYDTVKEGLNRINSYVTARMSQSNLRNVAP